MTKRTSIKDAKRIDNASDIEEVVSDKRQGWRANAATARLVDELANLTQESKSEFDSESDSDK
jgi:hypothetical protein